MAACVFYRRVARTCCLPRLSKDFAPAQHLHEAHGNAEAEADEQKCKGPLRRRQAAALQRDYRLSYNPPSYHFHMLDSGAAWSQSHNDEDEERLPTLAPFVRQQSNRYNVNCSRRLSSSKSTRLDLAFNKASEPETSSASPYCRELAESDVKVDTRAFQKCRPEYASMTLDLTQRPLPIQWEQALLLLHKVTVLKGNMTPSDVTQFLTELGRLHPDKTSLVRKDTRFVMLLRYSVENLHRFTQLQLLEVLRSFVWLDLPSTHSILGLYDAELCHRADQMSFHQLLLAADMWRCLGRQVPQFLQHLYDSVNLYLGHIGVAELVQLLYVMGEGRRCPEDLVRPVEQLLMRHLHKLEPEEIGTLCLALFKSQTSLSVGAVTCIVDKAYAVVEEMSDFAMVNVLKLLRFSYLDHVPWLEAMAQEVPRRAPKMGVQGLMHVALACSALHYRNDCILMTVAERLPSLVPYCRSKDSSKLLWAFGTLGVLPSQSPGFYPMMTEALRQRKAEFQQYPEHLLSGLLGLAFVSQLPEDLITLALSPEFVRLAVNCTQLELKKDLFTLDGTVALELPHWTGPRLVRQLREEVTDMLWEYAQSTVCQKLEFQEAECALTDLLGGEEFVWKRMILPHTRSIDLEVHLDSTGQPIPVNSGHIVRSSPEKSSSTGPSYQGWDRVNVGVTLTEDLLVQLLNTRKTTDPSIPSPVLQPLPLQRIEPDERGRQFGVELDLINGIPGAVTKPSSLSWAPQDLHKGTVKLAIQVTNRKHHCYHSQQLLGLHALKRRHLKLSGYRVVELSHWEWFPLLRKSREEKLAYLHCKIYSSLE
ncbi:FAST kinase domain-containing protein 5, mitochondrial [Diretmus argenteus]